MPARTTASRLSPTLSAYAPNRVLASSRPHQIVMTAVISTGTGTHPPRLVLPNVATEPGIAEISCPLLSRKPKPVATPSVPSVTTNGGMPAHATRNPLTRPNAPPARTAAAKPSATTPTAAPAGGPEMTCVITQAPAVPAKPSTAPTDRSMPPAQMTNVSPAASSSTSVAVLEVFSQFARVRKYGESMLKPTM